MAVSKVVYGDDTLIDLTSDTVTADTLASGVTAHAADGQLVTGTMVGGVEEVSVSATAPTDENIKLWVDTTQSASSYATQSWVLGLFSWDESTSTLSITTE